MIRCECKYCAQNVERRAWLRRRNPAQTLNHNIGVALLGELGARGIVLFDLSKTHSEQDIWGDDALLSYIYFGWEEEDLCPANRYVAQKAVAKHGWGPVAFELAMHVTVKDGMEGLVPDRREISDDGFTIWKRFYQRDDINKQPLADGALWGEDYLDSVYTLQHKPRYYFHKHRANKRLLEIFPYPGEAETHLWEAAEAWFSSEFDGGRYRPSTPKGQRKLRHRNPDDLETLELMVEARRLYQEQGRSVREISIILGVSRYYIKKWISGLENKCTEKVCSDPKYKRAVKLLQRDKVTSLRSIAIKAGLKPPLGYNNLRKHLKHHHPQLLHRKNCSAEKCINPKYQSVVNYLLRKQHPEPLKDAARKFDVTYTALYSHVEKYHNQLLSRDKCTQNVCVIPKYKDAIAALQEDNRITIKEVAAQFNLNYGSFIDHVRRRHSRKLRRAKCREEECINEMFKEAVAYLRNNEITIREAERRFDIPTNRLHNHLKTNHPELYHGYKRSTLLEPALAKAKEIYKRAPLNKYNRPDVNFIADQTGLNVGTIYRWLRDGLLRRNPDDLETLEKMVKARELYQQGMDITEIADTLGVAWATIKTWTEDLPAREGYQYQPLYERGMTDRQIAKQLGCTIGAVKYWRKNNKLAANRGTSSPVSSDTFQNLYDQGMTDRQIAEHLSLPWPKSRKRIAAWRSRKGLSPNADPRIAEARSLYQAGISNRSEIARQVGASLPSINKWLADLLPKKYLHRRNPDGLETLEKIAEARKLRQRGMSIAKIAHQLKAGNKTIINWVKDLDLSQNDQILHLCKQQDPYLSYAEISSITGLSVTAIYNRCKKAGIKRHTGRGGKGFIQHEDYKELWDRGLSRKQIAEKLDTTIAAVDAWRFRNKIPSRRTLKKQQARELFLKGWKQKDIAAELEISAPTVRSYTKGLGRSLRRRNPDDLETLEKIAEARALYKEGVRIQEIRKVFDVPRRLLNAWLEGLEDPRIKEAKRLYKEGHSISWISKQLQANAYRVKEWVAGLEQIKPKNTRREQAIKLYQEGHNVGEIAKELRAARTTVKRWVKTLMPEYVKKEQARELYHDGEDITDIAQKLGVPRDDIVSWVADLYYRYDPETFEVWYDPPQ